MITKARDGQTSHVADRLIQSSHTVPNARWLLIGEAFKSAPVEYSSIMLIDRLRSRIAARDCLAKTQLSGGEGGIRTPGTLASTSHFECDAIDHSATSPQVVVPYRRAALVSFDFASRKSELAYFEAPRRPTEPRQNARCQTTPVSPSLARSQSRGERRRCKWRPRESDSYAANRQLSSNGSVAGPVSS
jgi:hypothetical protein